MANNAQVQFVAAWAIVDSLLSPNPTIISRSLNTPTLNLANCSYLPYTLVPSGTLTLALPDTTIWLLYVRNLSNTNNITLNYTPTGGSSTSVVLLLGASTGTGGFFVYMQPAESAGGITAVSLTGTAANTPADVIMGA